MGSKDRQLHASSPDHCRSIAQSMATPSPALKSPRGPWASFVTLCVSKTLCFCEVTVSGRRHEIKPSAENDAFLVKGQAHHCVPAKGFTLSSDC